MVKELVVVAIFEDKPTRPPTGVASTLIVLVQEVKRGGYLHAIPFGQLMKIYGRCVFVLEGIVHN